MEDSGPQDIHFAWDDIMEYKALIKAPKPGRRPAQHLSISEYPSDGNQKDDPYDSDVDTWSETESNLSTGRSSVAESHSTRTSVSFGGVEDPFGDEDQIEFPSYDDATHIRRVSDLCDGVSALPSLGSTEALESTSLETIEHAEDDVAISEVPSRHVDYLSHNWCEEDIWSSWKHLKSKRKIYSKKERLENAAWRIWEKERRSLPTISPESINWMKDRDVTWLYGPFQTVAKELDLCYTSGAPVSFASQNTEPSFSIVRSILKKRTLSEALLQRSVSSSSIAKQVLWIQDQTSNVEYEPPQLTTDDSDKKTVRFAPTRTDSDPNSTTPAKNVRFHHEVEQYMAVEDESHNDAENKNNSVDLLKLRSNKRSSSYSGNTSEMPTPRNSESGSKTILALPKTTLKVTESSPHSVRPADKPASWTPCSYLFDAEKGTVRELEPSSTRVNYDVDDDDEEEDWIESFTPTELQDEAHRRRFMMISGGEPTTPSSRDSSPDEQYQSESASHDSNRLLPAAMSTAEVEMEKSSTGTESDLDSDSESTSETSNVESDDTSSDDSGYGYLCDFSTERSSQGRTVSFILDPVRQDLVNRIMDEFWNLFDQNWDTDFSECTTSTASSSESGAFTGTPSSSAPSQQIQRKRQRLDDDDGPDDNKDRKSRQPRRLPAPGNEGDGARFACPFRKHDPRQYNIYNNRVCALSHWQSIARVKEHLYRCHQISPHCKRCWRTFKTYQQLDAHITVAATEICEVQQGNAPAGITPAIERQLRSRKKSHPNQTDEERWKDIYKLLFPNEEIPSPYFEAIQADTPSSPDSRDLANYEDYIRRELPRLVRSSIEEVIRRETQPLEAVLTGSLVGIIQDCQDRVFRAYRESQGVDQELVPRTASPPENTVSSAPPPPTWAEDWAADRLPFQSNFLDAAFEAPIRTEQTSPDLLGFGQAPESGSASYSDSGYASEPRCNCKEPCNCLVSDPNTQFQPNISGPLRGTNRSWNESTPYPAWHKGDLTEEEADWWMNI